MTEGRQGGSLSHKAALPPRLPFGLSDDDHFNQAMSISRHPLPMEQETVLDEDLEFAAHMCTHFRGKLRELRQEAISVLHELQSRWKPVGRQLRSFQSEAVQKVTVKRDLNFTALLIVLQSWADTSYPFGLVRGLPAVGFAPHYGVFPQQPACMISQQDVLDGWLGHNRAILQTLRAGKDDEVLLEQSEADAAAGFCTPPLTQQQLQAVLQQRPYRVIPRCIIVQSCWRTI